MGVKTWIEGWPAYRQADRDRPARAAGRRSRASGQRAADRRAPRPPTRSSSRSARTARSAAGRTCTSPADKVVQIEGDPDSPVSRGRLCPKGSASLQLTTGSGARLRGALPAAARHGVGAAGLDEAMDMIADRVIASRRARLAVGDDDGKRVRRTLGLRLARRRDARQRRELPDQEAVHRARGGADREPGPYLTLRHRPRSGDFVRPRRRHHARSRTCRTPTASSSRARTWPSAIRSGSSG